MKEVIKIFEEIKNTSSTNDKMKIIDKNKDNQLFIDCLKWLLDDNITTGISKKKINKNVSLVVKSYNVYENFENVIEYLSKNNTGTDYDIAVIQLFIIIQDVCDQEFYEEMICKSYKLGADAKLVNKVIPNLIPTFDIMLGTPIEKVKLKGDEWICITHKMNGTRVCYHNGALKSRQNKLYIGLNHIIKDIEDLGLQNMFIDGELVYKNREGLSDSDAFQKGCSIAMSKDNYKSELKMVVFDIFPVDEFDKIQGSKLSYKRRMMELDMLKDQLKMKQIENISIVERLYQGIEHEMIWKCLDYADKELGWEGIMVNLDTPYECKRSKNLIKCKKFFDIDLRCVAVNIATSGKYKGKLGSVTCKFNDNTVDVGSGWSDEEREYYTNHKDELLGKLITIKYKEITTNKDGKQSLQFPVKLNVNRFDKDKSDDE